MASSSESTRAVPRGLGACPTCGGRGALAAACACGTAFVPDAALARGDGDPLLGRALDGRFVVLGLFATGAMAGVYEAVDRASGAPVVVKVLRTDGPAGDDALRIAQAEVRALSGASPHLARLLGHGEARGALSHGASYAYLALERLGARAFGRGAHPSRAVVPALAHGLAGLSCLHGRGWIHGDVKTAHLLARERPAPGAPPVCWIDLGAARPFGEGLVAGSRGYARESAPLEEAQPGVDLYALGCVAHELLTGRLPAATGARAALRQAGVAPRLAAWVLDLIGPGTASHATAIEAAAALGQATA